MDAVIDHTENLSVKNIMRRKMKKNEANHILAVLRITKEQIFNQLNSMYSLLEEYIKDRIKDNDNDN